MLKEYKVFKDPATKIERVEYFDEHWYKIDGEWYPSVSKVLGEISKGFGFEQWLRNTGSESKIIAREAADSGSKLHNAIELMLYGNALNMEQDNGYTKLEWKKLNSWLNWYSELKIEPLGSELMVYSKLMGIAGTLDHPCVIYGEVWILDWKTGNNIYDSSNLQVASYFMMYNAMIKAGIIDYPVATRAGIVHIGAKNKTFKDLNAPGIKLVELDVEKESKVFQSALEIYKWRNPNAKPPMIEYDYELKLDKKQTIETTKEN